MTRKTLVSCIIIIGVGLLAAHAAHALGIDDLKHHYCHWAWDRTAEFTVVDFGGHCAEADVLLIDDGVVLRSQRVAEGEESSIVLDGADGYFELRATCGAVRASAYAHADRVGGGRHFRASSLPRDRGVGRKTRWCSSCAESATRVSGTGETSESRPPWTATSPRARRGGGSGPTWATSQPVPTRSVCSCETPAVATHPRSSSSMWTTPTRRSFSSAHATSRRCTSVMCYPSRSPREIRGGLPVDFDTVSGLRSVRLYLNAIPGEFSTGVELCRFPGPWMIGFSTRSSCSVQRDLTPGFHKLIAVAEDRVGNTGYAERFIFVGP